MSLGKLVKEYRKANKITQTQLGNKLGYSREAIRLIEEDKYGMPPLEKLDQIAKCIGITFEKALELTHSEYQYKGERYYKIYINKKELEGKRDEKE